VGPEAQQRRVTIERSLYEQVPPVLADAVQVQQVVVNLVVNALDALVTADGAVRRVRVGTSPDGDGVELLVEDTGPGIAPGLLSRIFEPFVTTKGAGLGMGLSIIKSIVEAHGGHISGANREGGGAAFRCRLPRSGEPASLPRP